MNRPPFEVADIIRQYGNSFIRKHRSWLTWLHLRVLFAIVFCRTATLGGHLDRCSRCGHEAISYCSCRNRHCPKCQTNARNKWLAERSKELLPVSYVHVVFTLPHELSWLALQNKKVVYDLLFRTSATTLLEVVRSRCPASTLQRASARLPHLCLQNGQRASFEAKRTLFELPPLLTALLGRQNCHLATRAVGKPPVPECSNSIQYP
jgi:hypothetical protein